MHILVLENDGETARLYQTALVRRGHEVTVAHDTETAVDTLCAGGIDLMIADLIIGDDTAIPALDCARFFCPHAEVILTTNSPLFPSGELHYGIAHVAYRVQKPIHPDDLTALVSHCARTTARGIGATDLDTEGPRQASTA